MIETTILVASWRTCPFWVRGDCNLRVSTHGWCYGGRDDKEKLFPPGCPLCGKKSIEVSRT